MLVNYVTSSGVSPLNVAAARVLLGGYLIWKTVWYDWGLVVAAPYYLNDPLRWAVPAGAPWVLSVEKWVLIGLLIAFVVGYRVAMTSYLAALLLGHLATVRMTQAVSGGTTALFFGVYFLLFFGLYREQDLLSVDGLRRTGAASRRELNALLKADRRPRVRGTALALCLLVLALVYFGAGVAKLRAGWWFDLETAWNLRRILSVMRVEYAMPFPAVTDLVRNQPVIAAGAAWGTLVIELGLLGAVLAGVAFLPASIGLLGMTTVVVLVMGILFGDVYFVMGLFVAWERGYRAIAADGSIDVVYDENCQFCLRSLFPVKLLDVNDTITFYSQSDLPDRYRDRDDVEFDAALYAFDDGTAYRGFDAVRLLLARARIFFPLVWLLRTGPVDRAGQAAYAYLASNRDRYFTCGGEGTDEEFSW